MNMKTLSIYKRKIFIFFITMVLILYSGNMYQTLFPLTRYLPLLAFIFLIPIVYVYLNNYLNILLTSLLTFIVMVMSTMILSGGNNISYYINFISGIILAFGIVIVYDFEDFVEKYLKVMVFVSISSLLGYYLLNNSNLLDNLPFLVNQNGVTYSTVGIFSFITTIPERNIGIFWEPGIYATFLIYAILLEIIDKSRRTSYVRIVLFSITIITTNSSAGFVLWFFSIIFLLLDTKLIDGKFKGVSVLINIIFLLITLLIILNLDNIIMSTFLKDNEYIQKILYDNIRESSRMNAVVHNLKVFAKAPIFGVGIGNALRQIEYVSDTSSSSFFLSIYGIMGSLYTFYIVYGIFSIRKIDISSKILLLIIFISIVNKEPHGGILFSWILLFYSLKQTIKIE